MSKVRWGLELFGSVYIDVEQMVLYYLQLSLPSPIRLVIVELLVCICVQ